MTDRTPAPPGTGPEPAREPAPVADRSPFWPWLLLLVAGLTVGVLLAWRPWAGSPTSAEVEPDATATSSAPATPSPSPSASGSPTAAVFDASTAPDLFFTDAELGQAVPDAAGSSLAEADDAVWGLPEGARVTPAACTTAVTVVEDEPDTFLRRFAADDAVTVVQGVVLLADAAAAEDAFEALVATLGTCDAYQQDNPGVDGGSWAVEPPTTERGDVSTTVHRLTLTAEGATSPEVEVTALAGNALVTTTVSGVDPAAEPADPAVLAEVARSAAERALAGLG